MDQHIFLNICWSDRLYLHHKVNSAWKKLVHQSGLLSALVQYMHRLTEKWATVQQQQSPETTEPKSMWWTTKLSIRTSLQRCSKFFSYTDSTVSRAAPERSVAKSLHEYGPQLLLLCLWVVVLNNVHKVFLQNTMVLKWTFGYFILRDICVKCIIVIISVRILTEDSSWMRGETSPRNVLYKINWS